jgi:3-oxoacyl-[acyl-carrier-protein] synthase II
LHRRVVITGIGLVTPLGVGTEKTWSALCAGQSGIGEITRFDPKGCRTRIAGEVRDFNPEDFLTRKEARRTHLFVAYAVAAARMALADAGLDIGPENADGVGVIAGCALGGLSIIEDTVDVIANRGPGRVSPFFIPALIGNMAAGMISIQLGLKGPNTTVATACASGAHAVGDAYLHVKYGRADAMITGGVESMITPTCIAGFNAMKALSTRNEAPEKASRPFDRDRDGFVVGEGSGMMVLESLESALGRGATIFGEICGYGMTADAFHMTAPPPDGDGAVRCMQAAIADAGMGPEEIEYINAHGTSTPLNDISETRAVKKVFGGRAGELAISSTKSMTGHLLGGAGGVETAFTALTLYNGILPPTINLDHADDLCDLDHVPNVARRVPVRTAMTNSFGFGGTNACLVLRKIETM